MDSKRTARVGRLIQKELGEIFLGQTRLAPGTLVSVTSVRVTPDLSIAKTYLSIFPSEKSGEIMKAVKENARTIRFDLGTRVGKQLRIIPELAFYLDDSLDYIENIDQLLKK